MDYNKVWDIYFNHWLANQGLAPAYQIFKQWEPTVS